MVLVNIFFSGIDKASAGIAVKANQFADHPDAEILENDHDFFDDITDPDTVLLSATKSPAGNSAATPNFGVGSSIATPDTSPLVNQTGKKTDGADSESLSLDSPATSGTITTTPVIRRSGSVKKAIKRSKNRVPFPNRGLVNETKETSPLSNSELHRLVLIKQLETFKEMKELKEKEIAVLKEIKLGVDKLAGNTKDDLITSIGNTEVYV